MAVFLLALQGVNKQQRQLKLILEEIDGQINSLVNQLGLKPEEAYIAAALSAESNFGKLTGANITK